MKLVATKEENRGGSTFITEFEMQGAVSLRDYFAGQALTGIFAANANGARFEDICEAAYKAADAMLAERNKGEEE